MFSSRKKATLSAGHSNLHLGSIKTTPISSEEGFFGDNTVTAAPSQLLGSCKHFVAQKFPEIHREPDMETSLCLKKLKQQNPARAIAQWRRWFNRDAGPAIIVPAQGAVQHRIHKQGLVKLVAHLVGVAVKILPCK